MQNFRNPDYMKKQYATDRNLNSRVLLHQLFSTNKFGWSNWVFQNYRLHPGQCVLELGCGNAGIWSSNNDKIPASTVLTLTDFSEGMLDAAKINTTGINATLKYAVVDAQSIPYCDNTFDIVIANHMLYHVQDIHIALKEISRVLKPDGTFYATTIGRDNMKEIAKILHGFDSAIDFAFDLITEAFGLETGGALLSHHFSSIEILRYEDSLHITEPGPLIDYILSSEGIGNVNEIIVGENIERFKSYIHDIFSRCGYIDIRKDAGMFISSRPKK